MQPDFDADSQVSQVFVSKFHTNSLSLFYGNGHIDHSGLHECVVLAYLTNSALCALWLRLFFHLDLSLTLAVKLNSSSEAIGLVMFSFETRATRRTVSDNKKDKALRIASRRKGVCFVVSTGLIVPSPRPDLTRWSLWPFCAS